MVAANNEATNHKPVLSSFMTYHRVCNKSNTTGATCLSFRSTWVHPRFLVGCMVLDLFVEHCLSFCLLSFGHGIVCSSSIYCFWLLLWCHLYQKNVIHITTSVSRRSNILCIKFNIRAFFIKTLLIQEGCHFTRMWKTLAWLHHFTKRGSLGP